MNGRLGRIGVGALGASLLAAGAAPAATPRDAGRASPWATINICDTAEHPDAVGISARMAGGGGAHTALKMRFRLQHRRAARWLRVDGAVSPWVEAGRGDVRSAGAGWTFTVTPPPQGRRFVLRGHVTFRWVRAGEVVRTATRVTRGGHPGTTGADPATSSMATCAVR